MKISLRFRFQHSLSRCSNAMSILIMILIVNACIAGTMPATPENITVTFLTPTTVRVSWQTTIDLDAHPVEKYIVTYKPTDDRVVQDVAGNSEAIILDRLSPSTQYSIAVTAIWLGKKYRSRQIIFKTLDMPKSSSQQELQNGVAVGGGTAVGTGTGGIAGGRSTNGTSIFGDDISSTVTNTMPHGTRRELPTIRGVEIGIVLIVLMVWAGAIALFFNRWGKIRMLLPYQPDYKHEQLKVPGTGVCTGVACNGQHSHQFDSSECAALAYQPLHCNSRHFHMMAEEPSTLIAERCTRSRINSAIFVSSEGRGFDSIEFLRRHGSQSVLCRKARSAENITDNARKKSFSDKRSWRTDEEPTDTDKRADDSNDENLGIELQESRPTSESRTVPVLKSIVDATAQATTAIIGIGPAQGAAVTTANVVIGSISIEAPPAHMKEDLSGSSGTINLRQHTMSSSKTNSTSHDSADTVEELVLVPTANVTNTADATTFRRSTIADFKPHGLVRQRSFNTYSTTHRSQSPSLTTSHSSPKALNLKLIKPQQLPMVSIEGPSPTQEKPPPAECL